MDHRSKAKGEISCNRLSHIDDPWADEEEWPEQASLFLQRGDAALEKMAELLEAHPLFGRHPARRLLTAKVNRTSPHTSYESLRSVQLEAACGWTLAIGFF